MLNQAAFVAWCQEQALSEATSTIVARIRSSPPSRLVRSAAGNVSGRYASHKMGMTIQFESHRDELAFIYTMESDPTILEFYDQPEPIKLQYHSKHGRKVSTWHTPDFFVLSQSGAGWVECKMESTLLDLAETQPERFVHYPDGTWSSPAGEAYATSLGLTYKVRSSGALDWTYIRNFRFLEDYLRGPVWDVSSATHETVYQAISQSPSITLQHLLHLDPQHITADEIYRLLVAEVIYVDWSRAPLAEPEHVCLFVDRATAETYATLISQRGPLVPLHSRVTLCEGTILTWDGKPWTILNVGDNVLTLLSATRQLAEVPYATIDTLVQQGQLRGMPISNNATLGAERLRYASPKHLAVAVARFRALGETSAALDAPTVPPRTQRRWRANFQAAQALTGNGFVGLLPDWCNSGNRTPRLPEATETLTETFIRDQYETLAQPSKYAAYLLLKNAAEVAQVTPPSYTTFLARIGARNRTEQTRKRQGPRAANSVAPWYWELEQTTPRHGDRPWEIVHLDHTQIDAELCSTRTGRGLGRPWASFLSDAYSRRLLAVYLSYDPPSYRSTMMIMRECVRRFGRFPQTLIVDGGPEFRSIYFETMLAYFACTKATRPWAKPHYGSVCERLFHTANSQFIHTLTANTQIMRQVRQVTKAIQPSRHALWTLGDLYAYLAQWAYEVYDQLEHASLGLTPRALFANGIATGGERRHREIAYDDQFRYLTLPTTRKTTAKVESGRGVKINYLYYWSDAFLHPEIEERQVPVRYDPFNIGVAYAYMHGDWIEARSEYYLQLRGHSERELQIATAEIRRRYQTHAGHTAITAKRLADFLTDVQAHEALLLQRFQDIEARDVFAQLGEGGVDVTLPSAVLVSLPTPAGVSHADELGDYEGDDETLLDAYEEYH